MVKMNPHLSQIVLNRNGRSFVKKSKAKKGGGPSQEDIDQLLDDTTGDGAPKPDTAELPVPKPKTSEERVGELLDKIGGPMPKPMDIPNIPLDQLDEPIKKEEYVDNRTYDITVKNHLDLEEMATKMQEIMVDRATLKEEIMA